MSSSSPQAPVIVVDNVSHAYKRNGPKALNEVSLAVLQGSCFGLLGPNGAGKSTLLSLMTGVLEPQSGSIEIAGSSVRANLADVRSRSALVPQDYAFYPELTGRQNLRFFAGLHRLSEDTWDKRLKHCNDICDLEPVLDQAAGTYSGGLKRRLNFAIGLLSDPDILYLDEPTVGIDALSRQTIMTGIKHLNDTGRTVIYTSHYMEEVEAICDHIAVINRGSVMANATVSDLLSKTRQKTLRLEFAAPPDHDAAALITQRGGAVTGTQAEFILQDPGNIADILTALNTSGSAPIHMRYGGTRLEDVYLSLLSGEDVA